MVARGTRDPQLCEESCTARFPDFDFLTYVIENLGFVAVTKIAPNAARIRF